MLARWTCTVEVMLASVLGRLASSLVQCLCFMLASVPCSVKVVILLV
jgi:hypothetical protein